MKIIVIREVIVVKCKFVAMSLSMFIINIEQLFAIATFGRKKFIIGGIYIPPSICANVYNNHLRLVEILRSSYVDHEFIIEGVKPAICTSQ